MKKTVFILSILTLFLLTSICVFANPGDLDISFSTDGYDILDLSATSADDLSEAVALDGSGRILAVGYVYNGTTNRDDFAIVRYNNNGTLDDTFDGDTGTGNGIVSTDVYFVEITGNHFDDHAHAISIQDDGKIVVAGYTNNGANNDFAIVRYNTDGTLDTSFGGNGIVITGISGISGDDEINSIALYDSDSGYPGFIIAAGSSNDNFAVARYNSVGSIDTSFDSDGYVITDISSGYSDEAYDVAIQDDDFIVAVGYTDPSMGIDYDFATVRYTDTGGLDTSFDTNGYVITDMTTGDDNDTARSVVIANNGTILVSGYSGDGSNHDFALARYDTSGNLDSSFNTDGMVTTDIASGDDKGYAMAIQSDGSIIVVGSHNAGGDLDFAIIRYNTNGSQDPTFGSDGIITSDFEGSGSDNEAYDIAIQSGEKAVIAGRTLTSTWDFTVARYDLLATTSGENNPPATPTAESPLDDTVGTTSVVLESSAFSDPDSDDAHASTDWRVRREDRGVYYCDDYDDSFNQTYASGEGLTSHEIFGLVSGMRYVWQVRYQDSNEAWSAWSDEYRFTVGTSVEDNSVRIQGSTAIANYRMVSFPIWPDTPLCTSFFTDELGGAYDTTQLRLGTYAAQSGSYIECGDGMSITPGRSYWFLSRNSMGVDVNGIPVTMDLDVEIALDYNPDTGNGWNMIGSPNDADYNWSSVEVLVPDGNGGTTFGPIAIASLAEDNGYIDTRLWRWENGGYQSNTQTISAYAGYWVNAKTNNVYLRFRSDMVIADAGRHPARFAMVLDWARKWFTTLTGARQAMATGDTPPLPPGAHDEPETEKTGCFIQAIRHLN